MEDRDKFQLVYSSLVSEINRYRDWPIRVLTFTSALHFGVIGAFLLKDLYVGIVPRVLLSGVLSILWLWTVYYFYRCNENYLQARDTQRNMQEKLKLHTWTTSDGIQMFHRDWFPPKNKSSQQCWFQKKRFWGWGFYAFYASSLFVMSLFVIWNDLQRQG